MKGIAFILVFLAGVFAGATSLATFWYWQHSQTEIWTATDNLESANGIVIPAGSELILETWMPEGFAALSLAINVEGESLELFEQRMEPKSFYRIPYFVDRQNGPVRQID